MPRIGHHNAYICAAVLCSVLLHATPVTANTSTAPFPDTEKIWYRYREAITFLKDKGVIGGYPDGTFKPKSIVNRAEFLKIVFSAKGGEIHAGRGCFRDVRSDAWYTPYVCAAKNRMIVEGYKNGKFLPEQGVNMAEAIKMLLNTYGYEMAQEPGEQWYEPYVVYLDQQHILPASSYLPWEPLTRERAADLLARVLKFDTDRTDLRLSPGCGKTEAQGPTTVTVKDVERSYLLTAPRGYVSHDPSPLIVAFHGRTNSNEQVRSYFGLDREATDAFIAYPSGMPTGNGSFNWSDPGDKPSQIRDLALFDGIVKQVSEQYCVDMDQIFVVGHSLGAWMANSVACMRGGAVRAVATVGGNSVITDCTGPVSAMVMNNPADSLSPQSSAALVRDQYVREGACTQDSQPTAPESLSCMAYSGCQGGNKVYWCPHNISTDHRGNYYPHVWPEGVGEEIVKFFKNL